MNKSTVENLLNRASNTTSDAEMMASLKKARELAFKLGFDLKDIEKK
jgi:hypothetical protein